MVFPFFQGDIVIAKNSPRIGADMFTALIDMMAIVEGNIIKPNDPAFSKATNHALYGMQLKGRETLFYDKEHGFYIRPTDAKGDAP